MAFAASLGLPKLALQSFSGDVCQANLVRRVTGDKCFVCGLVVCFVTVRNVVVVLATELEMDIDLIKLGQLVPQVRMQTAP
jgi:hypothetical protein